MAAPDKVKELVETFHNNIEVYKKGGYNETQVRLEFINPLFEQLGWDVRNKQGYAEAYKDVIHEDAIKVGGATKAPDYCFRIGGTRKFFVEAKAPSVNIKDDIHPAFQLRRYAWSSKLPLSILTDFEEFAVYDCRTKPSKNDKVSHSRILYLNYTDYLDRWEDISGIFSKEAILKGSFDKYAEKNKLKKGTAEVDEAFLEEIEHWRDLLARNIALRNPSLSQRELNYAVQQTIDRIIFLRICEDRGIENYGRLMALNNGDNVYPRLFEIFRKADEKYNSGLFHFSKERGRENYDRITPQLLIDDKVLKHIFKNLYYPDSPYEFSVLPTEILGHVYEQFLGKIIRLTPGKRAKIEEKPEVRKAGGVYYTPTYVVDYIVENTVGKLVEDKKPGPRGGVSKLKILDPACGSGSFLIGAYQYLLDWHRDQYVNDNPDKWVKGKTPRLYQSKSGEWRLTTEERKRILVNNIYGVDIDPQAVEVTKLSLLLKVLEGEDEESIGKQMSLFQERVLPDLGNNIKCGNSLIGPDFYERETTYNEDEIYRINSFDWGKEFSDVMKNGGFDAVIGNPPYGAYFSEDEAKYLSHTYKAYEYQLNSFVIFIEKGCNLLKNSGKIAYITPAVFLFQYYYKNIRKIILDYYAINSILVLNYRVFPQANIGDTCVFSMTNVEPNRNKLSYAILKDEKDVGNISWNEIEQEKFLDNQRYEIYLSEDFDLLSKIYSLSVPLGQVAECVMGIKPYQKGKGVPKQSKHAGENKIFDSRKPIDDNYKRYLIGKDIDRYVIAPKEPRYIKYGKWLAEPRFKAPFEREKIILRQTSDIIRATIDRNQFYNLNNIYNIETKDINYSHEYLLGVLNSKLMIYLYQKIVPEKGRLFAEIKKTNLVRLPIRSIDLSLPKEKELYKQMETNVEKMLSLQKKLLEASIPQTQKIIKRQIDATDKHIDQTVYQLYELTDEEIKTIEEQVS